MVGQLDLFKGKRQRGVAARGPTEFEIHCAVADYLRHGLKPGWVFWHTPNGGERPAFISKNGKRISPEGGRLQRMGTNPGVSDIIIAGPGKFLAVLELKRKGEKLTDAQLNFLEFIRLCGFEADWADTVDGALEIVRKWGAVRISRPT